MEDRFKGQQEDIVFRLTDMFEGMSAEEIDDAVKQAKERSTSVNKEVYKNELAEQFDFQMATLHFHRYPDVILEGFRNQRHHVLNFAFKLKIRPDHIPFVPVVTRDFMGLCGLMQMVRNKTEEGFTRLFPADLTNSVDVPQAPYFIYDVEDGHWVRGMSTAQAEEVFRQKHRFGLTADECINLCIHTPGLLPKHSMLCTASRYGMNPARVPGIAPQGTCPELLAYYCIEGDDEWGFPSCGVRNC